MKRAKLVLDGAVEGGNDRKSYKLPLRSRRTRGAPVSRPPPSDKVFDHRVRWGRTGKVGRSKRPYEEDKTRLVLSWAWESEGSLRISKIENDLRNIQPEVASSPSGCSILHAFSILWLNIVLQLFDLAAWPTKPRTAEGLI